MKKLLKYILVEENNLAFVKHTVVGAFDSLVELHNAVTSLLKEKFGYLPESKTWDGDDGRTWIDFGSFSHYLFYYEVGEEDFENLCY